jgi:hypothetical protein
MVFGGVVGKKVVAKKPNRVSTKFSIGPSRPWDGKKNAPPRAFAKSQTHPPTSRLFFLLGFVFSTFLGVSRQGEFKNTIQIFLQKVHVESFSQKNRQAFRCQFSHDFFCLSRVFLRDGSSKTLQKRFAKKSCRKAFTKNSTKNSQLLFLDFFYHVFGRFSVRGVQKHLLKYHQNKSDPSPFLASDPPTHRGGHRFVLGRPLELADHVPCG